MTRPRPDLLLIIQKGTPIFLHRAGKYRTNSMGSTSLAMATSWAFFFSIIGTTLWIPLARVSFLLVGSSGLPSALAIARAISLSFLAVGDSGLYLSNSLKSWVAVCLSRCWLN